MQGVRGSNPLSSTAFHQVKRGKLGKQAGTEPQQNPNPAATPQPGRLNAKQATVDSERR
jgi:hypothetical protein